MPSQAPPGEALAAYGETRYRDALAAVRGREDLATIALALRIHVRLRDSLAEAMTLVERFGDVEAWCSDSDVTRAVFSVLAGRVFDLTGSLPKAQAWYESARRYARASDDAYTVGGVWWCLADSAYRRGDLAAMERMLARCEAPSAPAAWRARACQLRAEVAAAAGQRTEQAAYYERALQLLLDGGVRDRWFEGYLLRAVATLSPESVDRWLLQWCIERARRFPWTRDQIADRFYTFVGLGRAAIAFGDKRAGAALLRDALRSAPCDTFETLASSARLTRRRLRASGLPRAPFDEKGTALTRGVRCEAGLPPLEL